MGITRCIDSGEEHQSVGPRISAQRSSRHACKLIRLSGLRLRPLLATDTKVVCSAISADAAKPETESRSSRVWQS
ncbi:uncharacterized protein B0H18DRAFT_363470 [Fomitopsis serialis]|uniref:uncharacterized protein n=1 Tax=Fomitopsis serialis TaxID=139415 RepID=UPI002007B1BF|nr:uncharacterized protein B0H18DRAFT_363470 [Neoantrodia serialis]KAH9911395.1 hypothetical protein B0H18DRAFT_363470 [Neoantrodia serialis]